MVDTTHQERYDYKKTRLGALEDLVGGAAALEALDDEPLPDEALQRRHRLPRRGGGRVVRSLRHRVAQ